MGKAFLKKAKEKAFELYIIIGTALVALKENNKLLF